MMKGFYIEVTNNLLDPKHRKRIGSSIWEFMWCLDKMTRVDKNGVGWVLDGRPIKLSEIKEDIGIAEPHISANINKLKNEGYINTKRTPYGLTISINKAKKRFNQKVNTDTTKRLNPSNEKVKSNITRQVNKTKDLSVSKADEKPFSYNKYLIGLLNDKKRHIHIIGLYWKSKSFNFGNKLQCGSAIKRELRPANLLKGYGDDKINSVMQYLNKNADFKWTLETVHKFIDEDMGNLMQFKSDISKEVFIPGFGTVKEKR